jgi:hypothetical protein
LGIVSRHEAAREEGRKKTQVPERGIYLEKKASGRSRSAIRMVIVNEAHFPQSFEACPDRRIAAEHRLLASVCWLHCRPEFTHHVSDHMFDGPPAGVILNDQWLIDGKCMKLRPFAHSTYVFNSFVE